MRKMLLDALCSGPSKIKVEVPPPDQSLFRSKPMPINSPPHPLVASTCSEMWRFEWIRGVDSFFSSTIGIVSYGSNTFRPPMQTRLGLWKKLGVRWFKFSVPSPRLGWSICWLDEWRASQLSTIIFLRSLWTQRSRVRSSAQWLLILGMNLIMMTMNKVSHIALTHRLLTEMKNKIDHLQVSLSAAWIHSWNSSGVGFFIKLNKALVNDRWPFQGMREISVSRPSYSWVKNWVPIFRRVSHKGAILRPPKRSNTLRR